MDIPINAGLLISEELTSAFEMDFNGLPTAGNVSLHDLLNAGFITLEELEDLDEVNFTDLVLDFAFTLTDLIESRIADVASLVSNELLGVGDLLTDSLDLNSLIDEGVATLDDLASSTPSLLELADMLID